MRSILSAVLLFASLAALADDVPLQNWPVPSTARGRVASNSNATAFVTVAPCRLVDTRFNGSGAFALGETRRYNISALGCTDVPVATAYSLSFAVVSYNTTTGGYIIAYPAGAVQPTVSTVNFGTGPPVANAAIVASGMSGQIDVYAGGATHLVIDINGYFIGPAYTLPATKWFQLNGSVANNGVVVGSNATTTAGVFTSGVLGLLTANLTDGSGVMGHTTSGTTWGVKGAHAATVNDGGGVLGIAGARVPSVPMNPAGVRGESQSAFGVIGQTAAAAGVAGLFHNAQGAIVRGGYLGNNTYGVYSQGDTGASGTKSFVDPHPTDPGKVIRFVSLEGPEAGTYFRGRGRFVRGRAVIEVPDSFRFTTEEEGLTVHLTPIGGLAMVAVTRQSLDRIEAEASRDVEFSYVVYGVRRGYRNFQPIAAGTEFVPENAGAQLPAYLNDTQKQRLIDNGTYNADGTVNLATALRLGWEKAWANEADR